ncbi:hypothetical protein [Lactobacillus taiwanensis]|uniref:hypothetical protein n=1 Tax=Lactobacillus taiwanensis TaxID=508451 RepID=UPI001C52F93C|nr:hypothetical protein [Lactobacillus taiwanensis]
MCKNRSYDRLVSTDQDLTFKILEQVFKDELSIRKITDDILIALEFKNRDSHYTNASALLADKNNYRGINIGRFGENINIMLDRRPYE